MREIFFKDLMEFILKLRLFLGLKLHKSTYRPPKNFKSPANHTCQKLSRKIYRRQHFQNTLLTLDF